MKEKIGRYKLTRLIAKGGMGEVFLAYDPDCRREIALKCIRSEYKSNEIIYKRFLKEALIASQLTHPNIIPIYSLSKDNQLPYYTMPYIDGKNLKKILVETLEEEKSSQKKGPSMGSIQSLTRIFLTVCEAVSYAHSQQIIHRDLKPENILIGKYGEVLIFDWGVADKLQNIADEDPNYSLEELEFPNLTSPGKIIGTLSFMAPERFMGTPANYQTDIYSLGVMLYMILTLKLPFPRKKLKEAKKNLHREVLKNPIEIAPYRDIPHALVKITETCLAPKPEDRYQSIDDLLLDLKSFIKGQADWIEKDDLHFHKKEDWSFHENVLISKHQAISDQKDALEWISLMISKTSFSLNTRLDTWVELEEQSAGLGLVLNATEAQKRIHILNGYDLWLSTTEKRPSKLSRNHVEVLTLPHLILKPNQLHHLRFEQINNRISFFLDGIQQFSYLSYLPLTGTRVGFVYRDTYFNFDKILVSIASPSLIISCLEVPDAFLANKNYNEALTEYRRIGHAFPGRHESREAFFRAGLTLLKQASDAKEKVKAQELFDQTLIEFENLKNTPGAPLEYLGKSLVYIEQKEVSEELKCLELAIRRYPKHPLLYLIYDQIIYRMYQSSHNDRLATHEFILLALRYNSYAQRKQMIDPLILNLAEKRGYYRFMTPLSKDSSPEKQNLQIITHLSFLLKKPYVLLETLDIVADPILIQNILICLALLNEKELLEEKLHLLDPIDQKLFQLTCQKPSSKVLEEYLKWMNKESSSFAEKGILMIMERALFENQFELLDEIIDKYKSKSFTLKDRSTFHLLTLEHLLLSGQIEKAKQLFYQIKRQKSLGNQAHMHFLEGCIINATEGMEAALNSFADDIETALPQIGNLGCLYLSKHLDMKQWLPTAFDHEIAYLYRQLYIFYRSGKDESKADQFYKKWASFKKD